MKNNGTNHLKFWAFGIVLVLADIVTKKLASMYLQFHSFQLIPSFLTLTYVENTGSGFGLFKNSFLFLVIVAIIALFIFAYWFSKTTSKSERNCIILLIAGTTGNLLNRLATGFVIDFIQVPYWPVFNVADSYITIGAIYLIIIYLFQKE